MNTVWNIITGIGVLGIAGALIYIGRKLQVLNSLVKTVERVKDNLKLVTDSWILGLPLDHTKLQNYSPVQLTKQGNTYLEQIGFVTLFEVHAQDFYSSIDHENPTNDYDIENAAIKSVIQLFTQEYFTPIKDYFYNNPKEDRAAFVRVAGTYVRDKYRQHKNVTP